MKKYSLLISTMSLFACVEIQIFHINLICKLDEKIATEFDMFRQTNFFFYIYTGEVQEEGRYAIRTFCRLNLNLRNSKYNFPWACALLHYNNFLLHCKSLNIYFKSLIYILHLKVKWVYLYNTVYLFSYEKKASWRTNLVSLLSLHCKLQKVEWSLWKEAWRLH